jgi:hypothetical protein
MSKFLGAKGVVPGLLQATVIDNPSVLYCDVAIKLRVRKFRQKSNYMHVVKDGCVLVNTNWNERNKKYEKNTKMDFGVSRWQSASVSKPWFRVLLSTHTLFSGSRNNNKCLQGFWYCTFELQFSKV